MIVHRPSPVQSSSPHPKGCVDSGHSGKNRLSSVQGGNSGNCGYTEHTRTPHLTLARPRLRPARCRGSSKTAWEQHRLGGAASLRIPENQRASDLRCTETEKLDSSGASFTFQGFLWASHDIFGRLEKPLARDRVAHICIR